eukprot:TRINITY_DN80777_c0_g1_i1.p1 TRINITY_DN80777_c0_g1~~TRINITY_DN80777_c0_g1_i1.p1  ORF type:complete len:484 (+),score=42.23 TRINITY_DN80777_c0_g1_i1:117-1568(+)
MTTSGQQPFGTFRTSKFWSSSNITISGSRATLEHWHDGYDNVEALLHSLQYLSDIEGDGLIVALWLNTMRGGPDDVSILREVQRRLRGVRSVIVGIVDGPTWSAGIPILEACDAVVVTTSSRFDAGLEILSSADAQRVGLVDVVVKDASGIPNVLNFVYATVMDLNPYHRAFVKHRGSGAWNRFKQQCRKFTHCQSWGMTPDVNQYRVASSSAVANGSSHAGYPRGVAQHQGGPPCLPMPTRPVNVFGSRSMPRCSYMDDYSTYDCGSTTEGLDVGSEDGSEGTWEVQANLLGSPYRVQNGVGADGGMKVKKNNPSGARGSGHPAPATQNGQSDEERKTTYMICNLPCWSTHAQLSEAIDSFGFAGKYDYIHLPKGRPSARGSCIRGYGFIKFFSADDGILFSQTFNGCQIPGTASKKVVVVRSMHEQGADSNSTMRQRQHDGPGRAPMATHKHVPHKSVGAKGGWPSAEPDSEVFHGARLTL